MTENDVEIEARAKHLNAPRLTPADIDHAIVGEDYYVFPGTSLTVCALILRNDFIVVGHSASVSPDNFDAELGRKVARSHARDKIWALEGYRLRQSLYDGSAGHGDKDHGNVQGKE
jgi:hypothetical protein